MSKLLVLLPYWTRSTTQSLLLWWRSQVACAQIELDGWCCYPAGRRPHLPSLRQVACAELELDCWCCSATLLDKVYASLRVARQRALSYSWTAGAATLLGRLVLLPYWT